MSRRIIGVACAFVIGCSGGPTGPRHRRILQSDGGLRATALPFFIKPFAGDFPTGNLFDHDKPGVFEDTNGYLLTMCGRKWRIRI